jgi:hypothetical protein
MEHLLADMAAEPFDTSMDIDMFVQIGSPSKSKTTIRHRTNIRPFVRVYSQVVEEIMPFSKPLPTTFVVTLKDLIVTFRFRILVGEDSEFSSVWDVLFDLDRPQIKTSARLNSNHHIPTDFLKSFANTTKILRSHLLFTLTWDLVKHLGRIWHIVSGSHSILHCMNSVAHFFPTIGIF